MVVHGFKPEEEANMKPEVFLPDDYRPAEDEPFMNERQLEYFRRKLIAWKEELLEQSAETLEGLQDSARSVPDIADRASEETDRALELRTRDRQRKLVSKIDSALRRIDNGEYGYCEMTGEPISLGKGEVGAKPGHAGARHPGVKGGPSWHQETQRFWPASSALATSTRCGTPGH